MSSAARLAPSLLHAIRRGALVVAAAIVVGGLAIAWIGRPSRARALHRDERKIFAANPRRGSVQLAGETMLTVLFVVVARRGLRVRI